MQLTQSKLGQCWPRRNSMWMKRACQKTSKTTRVCLHWEQRWHVRSVSSLQGKTLSHHQKDSQRRPGARQRRPKDNFLQQVTATKKHSTMQLTSQGMPVRRRQPLVHLHPACCHSDASPNQKLANLPH